MSINSISGGNNANEATKAKNYQGHGVKNVPKDKFNEDRAAKKKEREEKLAELPPASEYTPSGETAETTKATGKTELTELQKLLKESRDQIKAFERFVSRALGMQAKGFRDAWKDAYKTDDLKSLFNDIKVDDKVVEKAREMVSEDGYYGVKQTSERILSFAKAYAGDDAEKLGTMRQAFEAGYKAAEKAWGGELPEISKQTYDAVMKGFDELMGISNAETSEDSEK